MQSGEVREKTRSREERRGISAKVYRVSLGHETGNIVAVTFKGERRRLIARTRGSNKE